MRVVYISNTNDKEKKIKKETRTIDIVVVLLLRGGHTSC